MQRITCTLPNGTREALREISKQRGLLRPNISNEMALAVRQHVAAMKRKGGRK